MNTSETCNATAVSSVSYGVLPNTNFDKCHVLPTTRIAQLVGDLVVTAARDGSVILRANGECVTKIQAHSDWVSDLIVIDNHRFVTVGHDGNVVMHFKEEHLEGDIWAKQVMDGHNDYVKCIRRLSNGTFITAALGGTLAIWNYDLFERRKNCSKLYEFNTEESIYALGTCSNPWFQIMIGDCNGNTIFYDHSHPPREVCRLAPKILGNNVKHLKILDNQKKLLICYSNGEIRLCCIENMFSNNCDGDSDNNNSFFVSKLLNYPITCIIGDTSDDLLIGDSNGNILKLSFTNDITAITVESIHIDNSMILSLYLDKKSNILWYSKLNSTDIFLLDLNNNNKNEISLKQGNGFKKCCQLIDRIHVITQDILGIIEKWNILTCKIIKSYNIEEGDFFDIINFENQLIKNNNNNNNYNEVKKWFDASIKIGILFITIRQNHFSPFINGLNLINDYYISNVNYSKDNQFSNKKYYNIKKIILYSILNNFIQYLIKQDETFKNWKKKNRLGSISTTSSSDIVEEFINFHLNSNNNISNNNNNFKISNQIDINYNNRSNSFFYKSIKLMNTSVSSFSTGSGSLTSSETNNSILESKENLYDFFFERKKSYSDGELSQSTTNKSLFKMSSNTKFEDTNKNIKPLKTDVPIIDIYSGNNGYNVVIMIENMIKDRPISKITFLQKFDVNDLDIDLFENLENQLPYWLSEPLFFEDTTIDKKQDLQQTWYNNNNSKKLTELEKITFIVKPCLKWDSKLDDKVSSENKGIIKSFFENNLSKNPYILPKISSEYYRMISDEIIKVKTIKKHIANLLPDKDKIIEVANRIPVTEWIDLMCNGEILDDNLTLKDIKRCYWNDKNDVLLLYKRKSNSPFIKQ